MGRKKIHEEIKDIAPNLAKIDAEIPFSIPENYFNELPGIVKMKVAESKRGDNVFVRIGRYLLQPKYAIGVVAIVFFAFLFIFLNSREVTRDISADLSIEAVDDYIVENIGYVDEETFLDLAEVDINGLLIQLDFEEYLDDEYVADYLLNTFDELTLKEELL